MAETAIAASERQLTTDRVKLLRQSIRKSISCAPPDAFLWFILYWIEIQNSSSDNLSYLKMSYRFGPNEGWVAAKRNGFALAIFDRLPDDLKAKAIAEFAALVDSGFTEEAVANLTGPGWTDRQTLVAGLANVREGGKRRLANALRRRGIRLALPGLELPEQRPWN